MSAGVVHTRVFLLILVLAQLCAAVRDAVGDDEHAKPFDRASVEAPPDALDVPEGRGSTTLVAKFKARFSESQGDQGEFHRGSVESGSKSYHALPFGGSKGNYYYSYSYGPEEEKEVKIPETLQYYGAAAGVPKLSLNPWGNLNDEAVVLESAEKISPRLENYPARESVEMIPDRPALYVRNADAGGSGYGLTGHNIVCYFSGWAYSRPAPMSFEASDVDPTMCTHLLYSFAGLTEETLEIVSLDPERDIVSGGYKSAVGLKNRNPDLKVLIAIGGWNEGGKKYSDMASSKESRERFIKSVVAFIDEHQFDGLDLDWEYPGATDRDGKWADRDNFANLVDELHAAFQPHGWLLTAAVSAATFRINEGYDVPRIAEKLDLINVMTYDLRGAWDNRVDHHAPLYPRESDPWNFKTLNGDSAMKLWLSKGAPAHKLMLGIPFYGRSFTLTSPHQTKPGSASSGAGHELHYTVEEGFIAYYEACKALKDDPNGWTVREDEGGNPYAFKGDQWFGYDDPENVVAKMNYVKDNGFGGAMIWAIDMDDFRGVCGNKWPLLSVMNRILRPIPDSEQNEIFPLGDEVIIEVGEQPQPPKIESRPPEFPALPLPPVDDQETNNNLCEGLPAGSYPLAGSCDVFFVCDAYGFAHHRTCPDGLHFDEDNSICNWPDEAGCDMEAVARTASNNPCQSLSDGLYSDADDCKAMFWCQGGNQLKLHCPYGLFFDPSIGTCHFYSSYRCPSGVIMRAATSPEVHQLPLAPYLRPKTPFEKKTSTNSHSSYVRGVAGPYGKQQKNVVCYFSNWAVDREGDGKFVPENLDARLCTHVFYAFASLDAETLEMVAASPRNDIRSGFFKRVQSVSRAANPDVKVLLALGGWTDSGGDAYSRLVGSSKSISNFVDKSVLFLKEHNFDGLSIDWQYPVCWQSDCSSGPKEDRDGFTNLIKELNSAFKRQNLVLAASLSGYPSIMKVAYDLKALGSYLDLVNVMTYDYHGFWDGKTGHHSPIRMVEGDKEGYNSESALAAMAAGGIPKSKLHLGIPLYGQTFRLSTSDSSYGAPASGPAIPGQFTLQAGMLAFFEICSGIRSYQWLKVPGTSIRGPYAHHRNQWVSYDDAEAAAAKAKLVGDSDYGGVSLWTVDFDDFTNLCCQGANPIANAVSGILRGVTTSKLGDCTRPGPVSTPPPIPQDTTPWSDGGNWKPEDSGPTEATPAKEPPQEDHDHQQKPPRPEYPAIPQDQGQDHGQEDQKKCGWEGQTLADPSDCTKYFLCVNGEKLSKSCSGQLLWNPKGYCDWKDNVDCGARAASGSSAGGDTGMDHSDGQEQDVVEDNSQQQQGGQPDQLPQGGCRAGEYRPLPGECNAYTICVDGVPYKQRCAVGLHFIESKNSCDWPENSNCVDNVPSSAASVRTNAPGEGLPCDVLGAYAKDPTTTCGTTYFWCINNKWYRQSCQAGTAWEHEKSLCNYCAVVDGCDATCSSTGSSEAQGKPEYPIGQPPPDPEPPAQVSPTTTTTPRPSTEAYPPVTGWPSEHDYKIVCYFTNWAWYRPGIGKYKPEDIDPSLCTHIVYGFAVLDYSNLIMKAHDGWADFDNKFYEKVTEYKKKGIKVTLALGGWNDSQGDKYSRLVNNPSARAKFIAHAVDFILEHNFDGLDLDWEYPSCWQTDCKEERYKDKDAFTAWCKELHEAFQPHGLLLSAAVSPSKKIIDVGYNVPAVSQYLDWIAVMSYDYFGHWDKKTGHVAPMYHHPEVPIEYFNANYTINYWIEKGADRKKLVMGMPLYGQAFSINDRSNHGLNSPGSKGLAGQFTRAAGFLAYYEICYKIKNEGYTVVNDPAHRMGPYAYKGNQWVGFDDVDMIRRKSEYVRKMGLGGGMIWALDLDDFNNRCGEGAHPLLSTIKNVLGPGFGEYPGVIDGAGDDFGIPVDEDEDEDEDEAENFDIRGEDLEELLEELGESEEEEGNEAPEKDESQENDNDIATDAEEEYKVVCYFTNWAWYRPGLGKYQPDDIDAGLCTHIVYGFAVLDPSNLVLKPHDAWADIDNKFYEKVTALKQKRGRKVLLAIGGWNDSAGDKYSKLVTSPTAREAFTNHAVKFLLKHNFDGLDLDWEYPTCWQVNCDKGPKTDKENFAAWVKELKMAFKQHGLLLTAAVSPAKKVIDAGYDVPAVGEYLDYISVMTYDYHGQWDKKTGHVAPMYHHPMNANEFFNVNFTVHHWLEKGLSKKKLILGMPMYGQSFTLAEAKDNGLQGKSYGGGEAGEFTRARGFLAYYEICDKIKNRGWKMVKDPESRMGPYAFRGDQWVGFDDISTIEYKTQYVKTMGLGGAMIWALDLDDFTNRCGCEAYPLLKAINRGLGRLNSKMPEEGCAVTANFRIQEEKDKYLADFPAAPYNQCDLGNFKPDKGDCNKYHVCDNGEYHERQCPAGLHWDGRAACTWPQSSGCVDGIATGFGDQSDPDDILNEVVVVQPGGGEEEEQVEKPEDASSAAKPEYPARPVEPSEVPDTGFKVVCYFTNWAWYRQGRGKYTPEDIDPSLCTHVNYGFAVLDPNRLVMKPHDTWADLDNEYYTKVSSLKKKGIKVLIALGGWNDSEGDKYSRLVADPNSRARFIRTAIDFIHQYNFDGLDLDWEYPKCWQVNCNRGPDDDKKNFALFVEELSKAFKRHKLLLSAAVSPSKLVIDAGYDVPVLSKYLDIINVMTYDYHGHWDKKTGHVAPLSDYEGSTYDYFNAMYTMNYWKEKGADPRKLVMGIPMYGQAFTLANPNENGLNAKAPQRGLQGEFTRAAGFLAYYEICQKVKSGWTVVHHDREALGPYAFQGNQWVGYDDVAIVRRKSEYVKANGYGGAMIWALDLDDFKNVCGCEEYPLLRTINRVLRGYPVPAPQCDAATYEGVMTYGGYYPHVYERLYGQPSYLVRHQPYLLGAYHHEQHHRQLIQPYFYSFYRNMK